MPNISQIQVGSATYDIQASQLANARKIDGVDFDGSADISHYGVSSTAAGTITKTVSVTGFSLVAGAKVSVKFTNAQEADSVLLNVSSTGAKTVKLDTAVAAGVGAWNAGETVDFTYDGTNWIVTGVTKGEMDTVLQDYALNNGAYENMTVGNAEQLVSTVMVNDQEPYVFRTSGGSADIGDREYDTIVGGSLPWNQLGNNGDFSSGTTSGWNGTRATLAVNDGTLTVTATDNNPAINHVTNAAISAGHKILVVTTMEVDEATTNTQVQIRNSSSMVTYVSAIALVANSKTTISQIFNIPSDVDSMIVAVYLQNDSSPNAIIYNQMVIDLTQMFGTEIADYVYSLEQSNAGDGAAWFRRYFPDDYYAYNPGNSLLHVQGLQSHDMTGFNQWDEEWEVGNINDTTGQTETANNRIRSKNYIRIVPNTSYYVDQPISGQAFGVVFYDSNYNFIPSVTWVNNSFVTPEKASYLKFKMSTAYGTTYNHDICINLSWDGERNGEYEPYKLNSYPLDSTITLRGVPLLDENNKLKYDGDRYLADGTVEVRYKTKSVANLSLSNFGTPTQIDTTDLYRVWINLASDKAFVANSVLCDDPNFPRLPAADTVSIGIGSGSSTYPTNFFLQYPADLMGTTAQSVKDYFDAHPFTVLYPLATPTTETADPYQSPQIVDDFGTEEYVVTLQGDVAVPVGHDTNYANNLRAKLEMAPESPSGDGDYIVRQTSGQNAYVPMVFPVSDLPAVPSTDGTYNLQVSVSGGTATYSWVSA